MSSWVGAELDRYSHRAHVGGPAVAARFDVARPPDVGCCSVLLEDFAELVLVDGRDTAARLNPYFYALFDVVLRSSADVLIRLLLLLGVELLRVFSGVDAAAQALH